MSAERDIEIVRLYEQGVLLKHIAEIVGMQPNGVGYALKRLGYERPSKPQKKRADTVRAVTDDQIVKLWNAGLSTSAISESFRLSRITISKVLNRNGVNIAAERRVRYDGEGGTAKSSGGGLARIARRT